MDKIVSNICMFHNFWASKQTDRYTVEGDMLAVFLPSTHTDTELLVRLCVNHIYQVKNKLFENAL